MTTVGLSTASASIMVKRPTPTPRLAVMADVIGVSQQLQIFIRVVQRIPVPVMDVFMLCQFAPQPLLHLESMLVNPSTLTGDFDHPVTKAVSCIMETARTLDQTIHGRIL